MLFKQIQQAMTPALQQKIYKHPLNLGLNNGTLSFNKFRAFLEQDSLYLLSFSAALKTTANRLHYAPHQQVLYTESKNILETEMDLHNKYLLPLSPYSLFQRGQRAAPPQNNYKAPQIQDYTEFLHSNAMHAPIEVAVASMVPCFYIYNNLGLCMQTNPLEHNRYQRWINSYSSPHFKRSTESMISVMNEIAGKCTDSQIENMTQAFIKSVHFEMAFWDSIMEPKQEEQFKITDIGLKTSPTLIL